MPENKEKEEERPVVAKTAIDLQRLKLQKLMKNPDKPIILPERPKAKSTPTVPEFVRNVMGSSAGAGSGEFHVYRHLRRKEYARQKFIQEKSHKELLDEEYHRKIEENKRMAEEITAKKRAKRLKKKQKWKQKKQIRGTNATHEKKEEDSSNSEEDSSDEEKVDDRNGHDEIEVAPSNETKDKETENNIATSNENCVQQSIGADTETDCNKKTDKIEVVTEVGRSQSQSRRSDSPENVRSNADEETCLDKNKTEGSVESNVS